MFEAPALSVVFATSCFDLVAKKALEGLARQTLPSQEFEVIVVCPESALKSLLEFSCEIRIPLHMVSTEDRFTPATALNQGASEASAPLLLFLKGNMEPSPDLLEAHLAAHQTACEQVVIGYSPIPACHVGSDPFAIRAMQREDAFFRRIEDPGHRFTATDFRVSNSSIARDFFQSIGGFDPDMPGFTASGHELAVRMLRRGVVFKYCHDARCLHHEAWTYDTSLANARSDGFAFATVAQKHPELFRSYALNKLSRIQNPPFTSAWELCWRYPQLPAAVAAVAGSFVAISRHMKFQDVMWKWAMIALGHAYWAGVQERLGTLAELEKLHERAKAEPANRTEIAIDLATDLPQLDRILSTTPIDQAALFYKNVPVGRIWPVPAAERLKSSHVRSEILHHCPALLTELLRDESLDVHAKSLIAFLSQANASPSPVQSNT